MFYPTPADYMASADEYTRNYGEDHPTHAWILTPYDTWQANPFYRGPAVPHPESCEDEFEWA